MCSGLPQHMLDAIAKYDGAGISFICTTCRMNRGRSPSADQLPASEVLSQLFQQIKGICSTVKDLVDQVKALTLAAAPGQGPTSVPLSTFQPTEPSPQQPAVNYRSIVHEELKEMKERDKRKQSVIIKGLKATSGSDLAVKFEQLTEQQMGRKVSLSDISAISGHTGIYRAKITDDELRRTVLEKAKTLRNTEYNDVYISRDLTYAQRAELFARRKARREELAQTQGPAGDDPQNGTGPRPSTSGGAPPQDAQGN